MTARTSRWEHHVLRQHNSRPASWSWSQKFHPQPSWKMTLIVLLQICFWLTNQQKQDNAYTVITLIPLLLTLSSTVWFIPVLSLVFYSDSKHHFFPCSQNAWHKILPFYSNADWLIYAKPQRNMDSLKIRLSKWYVSFPVEIRTCTNLSTKPTHRLCSTGDTSGQRPHVSSLKGSREKQSRI